MRSIITRSSLSILAVVLTAIVVAGCGLTSQAAPSLTGPSEFGLSVTIAAMPNAIPHDGVSQATITVHTYDASGKPQAGQQLQAAVLANSAGVPVGSLSQSQIVTDSAGTATFAYIAPPLSVSATNNQAMVQVVPISASNFNPKTVTIALLGPSNTGAPVPDFTFAPSSPQRLEIVSFDASKTTDEGAVCNDACTYAWNFGGEATRTGRQTTYQFQQARTYAVTLTVVAPNGSHASTTQNVLVGSLPGPTAAFTASPASPGVSQVVNFSAAASTAAQGHTITNYAWNFGDGVTATGSQSTASHAYTVAGTFVVTLTVTDDAGQNGSTTQNVVVGSSAPTAAFTVSPSTPGVQQSVSFNASTSTAAAGHSIVSYAWNFGDGGSATSAQATTTHTYATTGSFVVSLTVTDDAGNTASTTNPVAVGQGLSPSFTISPTNPKTGANVFVNGSGSTTVGGASITQYDWDFGNGDRFVNGGVTHSDTYAVAGTYTITLTVHDSAGRTATTSLTVTVN
jgi:PKD repeat protein